MEGKVACCNKKKSNNNHIMSAESDLQQETFLRRSRDVSFTPPEIPSNELVVLEKSDFATIDQYLKRKSLLHSPIPQPKFRRLEPVDAYEVGPVNAMLKDMKNTINSLNEKFTKFQEQHAELKQENVDLKNTINSLNVKIAKFQEQLAELKKQNAELKQGNAELKQGNAELKQGYAELKQESADLKRTVNTLNLKLVNLQEDVQQQHAKFKEENEALRKENIMLKKSHEAMSNRLEVIQQKYDELQTENGQIKQEIVQLQSEMGQIKLRNTVGVLIDTYKSKTGRSMLNNVLRHILAFSSDLNVDNLQRDIVQYDTPVIVANEIWEAMFNEQNHFTADSADPINQTIQQIKTQFNLQ
jgi:predicted  nucleic acid-binding Zn-ribbon protein